MHLLWTSWLHNLNTGCINLQLPKNPSAFCGVWYILFSNLCGGCGSQLFNAVHTNRKQVKPSRLDGDLPKDGHRAHWAVRKSVFYKMKSVQTANVQWQMSKRQKSEWQMSKRRKSEWQMSIGKFPWQMCAKQVSLRLRRVAR